MASFGLTKLANRKLIKIVGPDCYPYLQGLFCNDLRFIYEPDRLKPKKHARVSSSVISSFMLNAQGRAVCDLLIYRTPNTRYQCEFTPPGQAKEPDELLIECDAKLASGLANTLYGYRVRRKISIEIMQNQSIWCLFPHFKLEQGLEEPNETSLIETSNALEPLKEVLNNELTLVSDPRLSSMGSRILMYDNVDEKTEFNYLHKTLNKEVGVEITKVSQKDYKLHRYCLGLGEGCDDHPEAACLPLECNADLLGSVNFEKGCYLGQELTARIHFTGVIRKRLMPLKLHMDTEQKSQTPMMAGSDIIEEQSGKKLGIIRHVVRDRGLGLIRHDLIDQSTNLIHEDSKTKITTWKPYWWAHNHEENQDAESTT